MVLCRSPRARRRSMLRGSRCCYVIAAQLPLGAPSIGNTTLASPPLGSLPLASHLRSVLRGSRRRYSVLRRSRVASPPLGATLHRSPRSMPHLAVLLIAPRTVAAWCLASIAMPHGATPLASPPLAALRARLGKLRRRLRADSPLGAKPLASPPLALLGAFPRSHQHFFARCFAAAAARCYCYAAHVVAARCDAASARC